MKKYYSLLRPVGPGTCPSNGIVNVENFDDRVFVPEIGADAWGFVEYEDALDQAVAESFDLLDADLKIWTSVIVKVYDDGKIEARVSGTKRAAFQPEEESKSCSRYDIVREWFGSKAEAEDFVKEYATA